VTSNQGYFFLKKTWNWNQEARCSSCFVFATISTSTARATHDENTKREIHQQLPEFPSSRVFFYSGNS